MFQAYSNPNDEQSPVHTKPTHPPASKINIELRLQSEYCSVSGVPLCFLQATIKSTGSQKVSLNRARPIIEFLEAKDDNASSGLPLLSLFDAADNTKQPIFSYQLDVCYQNDRERQLESSAEGIKSDDFILLSEQGYTFTHCINQPWSFITTYHQISKIFTNRNYKLRIGGHSEVQDPGVWYPKVQTTEIIPVHLELDPSSHTIIRLVG